MGCRQDAKLASCRWFGRVPWLSHCGGRTGPFTSRSILLHLGQAGSTEPGGQCVLPSPSCFGWGSHIHPVGKTWGGPLTPTAVSFPPVPCSLAVRSQLLFFLTFNGFSIYPKQQQVVKIQTFRR